jgi:hypothetical protein
MLHVRRRAAEQAEARPELGRDRVHVQMRARARGVLDRDECIVVHLDAGTPPVDLAMDAHRRTEEQQCLVDEMAAKIEEDSPARRRIALFAPSRLRLRAPSLEARLEAQRLAERARLEETAHRHEVAVPAAVLVDREHPAEPIGFGDEPSRIGGGRRQRLVDDHRQPRGERRHRQRHVRAIRRRDDDELQIRRAREQRLDVLDEERVRMLARRLRAARRVPRHDRGEAQPRRRDDQWRVEGRTGGAEADESDAKFRPARYHSSLRWRSSISTSSPIRRPMSRPTSLSKR